MTQASKQGIPELDANVSWVRRSVRFSVRGRVIMESTSVSKGVLLCCLLPRLLSTAASLNTVVKGCLAAALYTLGARRIFLGG